MTELAKTLKALGFHYCGEHLDDLVAHATKKRLSPRQLLEHVARVENQERARRSLERRLSRSRLGPFKPMADFDWSWPTKINEPTSRPPSSSTSSTARGTSSSSPLRVSARP